MPYLGTFMPEFEKTIVVFEISIFEFVKIQSLVKEKQIKFETKTVLYGYFRLEFEKTIVIFEISALKFVILQSFI